MTTPTPPDDPHGESVADLQRGELFYRTLFEAAGDAIIACSEDGRAIDCNGATLAMYRCSRKDLIGTTPVDRSPEFQPDGRRSDEAAAAVFARVLAGEMACFEWEGRRADASRIDIDVSVRLTQIGERRIIVIVSREITERKRAETERSEREALFREITESIREVFWVVTPDWQTVKYVSPAYEEIWGMPRARVYADGFAWLEAVVEAQRPALLAAIPAPETYTGCRVVPFPDYEIVRPDGTRRWIAARAYPIRDDAGKVLHFAGIAEDISARKCIEESLRRSRALLRATGEMANVGGWEIDLDSGELSWTGQVFRIHEVDPDYRPTIAEAIAFYAPESRPIIERAVQRAIDHGEPFDLELRLITARGNPRWVHAVGRAVCENGRPRTVRGAFQDITERKRAEAALRASEARYRGLADNSLDWVWSIDLDGRPTYSNRGCERIFGHRPEDFLRLAPIDLVHPDDQPLFRRTFEQAVAERRGWSNVILRWRDSDGDYRQLESSASALFDATGRLCGFQGMDRDITERKRQEEAIWRQANFDTLTGLANRNLLHDRLERALAHARRNDTKVGLIFLDLDGFKWINDTLGHDVGDELLVEVARRLRACVRDQDTVARLGGDEFTLVIHDLTNAEDLQSIGEKAVGVLRSPFKLANALHHVSASAGITVFPDDGEDVQTLLRCADIAMYQSKLAGKNRFQFYAREMQVQAQARVQLEADLRRAIAEQGFALHYQPIVDTDSGKLVGAEALLRWQHPERGMVSPLEFIPVAEDSGLIVGIGEWALREAARQWRQWQDDGHPPLRIAVNISGIQFREAGMPTLVAAVLAEYGIDHGSLMLEITESVLMDGSEAAEARMREIKSLGIRYALDDFGTGFSSLSYLKRFPVDIVKIDRSFVNDCPDDRSDSHLVEAIINMAHSLDLCVTAEGVETPAQLDFLRRLGCDYLQGYLISKPVPAAAFADLLRRGHLLPCHA